MHNRKKLNIGISSLILGALFLEFNVSQVKADNVKTDSNYTEQINTKIINQNVTSKNNVTAQNSVAPSKYEDSLVSSSTGTNTQNNLNGELLDSKEAKTVENGVQNSNNTVHHQSTPVTMSVNKDSANKWRYNSNIKTWSYIKSDGTDANQEWVKTKYNEWYYFDKNGNMAKNGWFSTSSKKENNGEKYYFDKDGHYLTNYWTYDPYGKTWSYAKNDGVQANDQWLKAKDNQWYYFDNDGNMVSNKWVYTDFGKIYYFNKDGHYLTNQWVYNSDDNIWSYAKNDGTQANEEWLKMSGGQWYYFDVSGIMVANGWQLTTWGKNNAELYYFDKNGHYLKNYWTYDSNERAWRYAKNDGTQAAADWLKSPDGYWYYFNDDGVMVTNGWHDTLTEGVWKKYYFDGNGHYLNIHWRCDSDRNGQPIANRWIYDPHNHIWSYTKNDKKQAREEWVKASDGRWYYFNDGGVMVANGWHNTQLKDGKWKKYYFDKDGHYLIDYWAYDSNGKTWSYAKHDGTQANEEWLKMSDGHWYYFNIIGIMPTNIFLGTNLGNGKWQTYYFDKDGHYLTNAWAYDTYDKIWSYAKKDGTLATNEWLKLSDDQWYYFTNAEVMAMNGWYNTSHQNEKIKLYYFDKNGHYLTNHWAYDADDKTWSYAKNDGTRAIQEWVKTTDGQWYYFDKNGNMVTDGYFDTYLGNGKWKKYYFDRDGHYYQI